ncbi:MAG TPA: hypothetical protein VHX11_07335 [Acidobacteriaceae bacterium]|nr:hypothetical protein [Acidobacteriaceae bacterium]
MPTWRSRRDHQSRVLLVVGLLCIALLLLGAVIQVAHTHADGAIHSDCALCATAHVAFATVAALALLSLFARTVSSFAPRPQPAFRRFDIPFELSNRPPPIREALS